MADYPISKEAAIMELINLRDRLGGPFAKEVLNMALVRLEGFPQMDAVPVVRCRNCRLWRRTEKHYGKCPFLIGEHQYTSEDGFCNLGEKMDGGAE